jgi:hypothetical protein
VRAAYVATASALSSRAIPTFDVSSRVRLTKTPDEYFDTREQRRELPYEALLTNGRTAWSSGERIRVYRARGGRAGLLADPDDETGAAPHDPRDYDIDHYVRLLFDTYAARLARALPPKTSRRYSPIPGKGLCSKRLFRVSALFYRSWAESSS